MKKLSSGSSLIDEANQKYAEQGNESISNRLVPFLRLSKTMIVTDSSMVPDSDRSIITDMEGFRYKREVDQFRGTEQSPVLLVYRQI